MSPDLQHLLELLVGGRLAGDLELPGDLGLALLPVLHLASGAAVVMLKLKTTMNMGG